MFAQINCFKIWNVWKNHLAKKFRSQNVELTNDCNHKNTHNPNRETFCLLLQTSCGETSNPTPRCEITALSLTLVPPHNREPMKARLFFGPSKRSERRVCTPLKPKGAVVSGQLRYMVMGFFPPPETTKTPSQIMCLSRHDNKSDKRGSQTKYLSKKILSDLLIKNEEVYWFITGGYLRRISPEDIYLHVITFFWEEVVCFGDSS